jgi:beta-glucosidase
MIRQFTTTFVPDESGDWEISLGSCGYLNLFFDGKLLIENNKTFEAGEMFFMMGSTEKRATVKDLIKGRSYTIETRGKFRWQQGFLTIPFAIRLGAKRIINPQDAIDAAASLAASSDLAIVVVGVTGEIETEGYDRKTIEYVQNCFDFHSDPT